MPLDSINLLLMLAQRHWKLVFPDLHGSGLAASEPGLVYSAQKRTNLFKTLLKNQQG